MPNKEILTWDVALSDWLNSQFNDYYAICHQSFTDGVRIVEHPATTSNDNFIRLIHNILPWTKTDAIPFSVSEQRFTLIIDGEQVVIKPYDGEIHHTEYVKEEV